MIHKTVTNVLGKSMAITSPIAIPNSANPTTRFIFIYPPLIIYLILFYASPTPGITGNYCTSALSRISFTSFSSSFESLPPVNLSTMSGTISRIFVIVSWFLIFTSLVCPFWITRTAQGVILPPTPQIGRAHV